MDEDCLLFGEIGVSYFTKQQITDHKVINTEENIEIKTSANNKNPILT